MMRLLVTCFMFAFLPAACVTPLRMDSNGFTHEALDYSLRFAKPAGKLLINDKWKLDPENQNSDGFTVTAQSKDGREGHIYVSNPNLYFTHKETKGIIAVQSFPLSEELADRKLDILAKDFSDRLSGSYFTSFANSKSPMMVSKSFVTNIVSSKAGQLGSAQTQEVIVETANAEQLKLNPQHRLMRYKMLLVKPRADKAWIQSVKVKKKDRLDSGYRDESFPALIVLTYAMDFDYFDEYLADFDGLVSRLKLRD